jgi:glycosyltransferase involved in cell wall biosynthesis
MADSMMRPVPECTIIIPTYNRATTLLKCLDALDAQTAAKETFEVIVSDDGSEDKTGEIVETFIRTHDLNVRYLRQPNSGQNAARNRAIEASRGALLLFINDDTIATPTMMERHVSGHRIYPSESVAVLGKVTISPELPRSIFARVHLDCAFSLLESKSKLDWRAFFTCNVSVKKGFLLKYGLFDESLRYNDDIELSSRLSKHGFRIIYDEKSVGYHYHYLTEADYVKLARLSGKTLGLWYKKSPHLRDELASVGFYKAAPIKKRIQYCFADLVINRATRPFFLAIANRLSGSHEDLALMFYRKIYKSLEREGIRSALHGKSPS